VLLRQDPANGCTQAPRKLDAVTDLGVDAPGIARPRHLHPDVKLTTRAFEQYPRHIEAAASFEESQNTPFGLEALQTARRRREPRQLLSRKTDQPPPFPFFHMNV
jgi:hypothetical protein